MVTMIEPELEVNSVQLTNQHRLSIDKFNKTLSFKYRKRVGKGRNAEYSNEYGYGNEKYFGTFEQLAKVLLDGEFNEFITEQINEAETKDIQALTKAVQDAKSHIDKVAKEIASNLNEKVVINIEQKKRPKQIVKGMTIEDDGDDD